VTSGVGGPATPTGLGGPWRLMRQGGSSVRKKRGAPARPAGAWISGRDFRFLKNDAGAVQSRFCPGFSTKSNPPAPRHLYWWANSGAPRHHDRPLHSVPISRPGKGRFALAGGPNLGQLSPTPQRAAENRPTGGRRQTRLGAGTRRRGAPPLLNGAPGPGGRLPLPEKRAN